jgi:hypothetical protein
MYVITLIYANTCVFITYIFKHFFFFSGTYDNITYYVCMYMAMYKDLKSFKPWLEFEPGIEGWRRTR